MRSYVSFRATRRLRLSGGDDSGANQGRLAEFIARVKGRGVSFEVVENLFPDKVSKNVSDLIRHGGVLMFAGYLSCAVTLSTLARFSSSLHARAGFLELR